MKTPWKTSPMPIATITMPMARCGNHEGSWRCTIFVQRALQGCSRKQGGNQGGDGVPASTSTEEQDHREDRKIGAQCFSLGL